LRRVEVAESLGDQSLDGALQCLSTPPMSLAEQLLVLPGAFQKSDYVVLQSILGIA
jgi:hypothetical protein